MESTSQPKFDKDGDSVMEPTYNEDVGYGYEAQPDYDGWGFDDEDLDIQQPKLMAQASTGPAFVRGTSFSLIEEDEISYQQNRMIK